jgi:hypothetical protein
MFSFSVNLKRRARSTPSGSSGKDASGTVSGADLTRAYARGAASAQARSIVSLSEQEARESRDRYSCSCPAP